MLMNDAIACALAFIDFPTKGKSRSAARTGVFQGLDPKLATQYRVAAATFYGVIWIKTQASMPVKGDTINVMVNAICAQAGHASHAKAFEALGIKPNTGRRWIAEGCPRWSDFLLLRNALEGDVK